MKVCDSNDDTSDGTPTTIRGQLTFIYTPNSQI